MTYLKELGIWPSERDGYYYPSSGQAASVAECLFDGSKAAWYCDTYRFICYAGKK